jgi:hypothetical protein
MLQMLQAEDQRLERLVRPEEVRMLLGISEPTFYRLVREKVLPDSRAHFRCIPAHWQSDAPMPRAIQREHVCQMISYNHPAATAPLSGQGYGSQFFLRLLRTSESSGLGVPGRIYPRSVGNRGRDARRAEVPAIVVRYMPTPTDGEG